MRMVQGSDDLGFLSKSLAERARADLNGYGAIEPRISGPVDLTHTACGHERLDAVRSQQLAGLQRNGRCDQLGGRSRGPRLGSAPFVMMGQQIGDFPV